MLSWTICTWSQPHKRSVAMHDVLREELWRHAKISVHHGKTCIWNRGGVVPDMCDELEAAARAVKHRARVWRSSHEDRFEDQGITILGTPVGRPEFVRTGTCQDSCRPQRASHPNPGSSGLAVRMVVVAFLWSGESELLQSHRSPRVDCCILQGARRADLAVFLQLVIIGPDVVAPSAKAAATLPLAAGVLGLRSALRLREAAHWASWADTINMVRARHPQKAEVIPRAMEASDEVPSVQAISRSVDSLADFGFVPPTWDELARLFTLQPLRTGSPTSLEWGGRHRQVAQWSLLSWQV